MISFILKCHGGEEEILVGTLFAHAHGTRKVRAVYVLGVRLRGHVAVRQLLIPTGVTKASTLNTTKCTLHHVPLSILTPTRTKGSKLPN